MKVEFGTGAKGYEEAESLLRIVRRLHSSPGSENLCGELERHALDHLGGNEQELARVRELISSQQPTMISQAVFMWHRFWGPSSGEMELSKQRGDALERAERAERSSFEALAEMAEVGRERDMAMKDVELLRQRIEQLENADNQ